MHQSVKLLVRPSQKLRGHFWKEMLRRSNCTIVDVVGSSKQDIEERSKNQAKSKENDHFWKAKNLGQSNSVNRFARSGRPDIPEPQCRTAGHWHHDASNKKIVRNFLFCTL